MRVTKQVMSVTQHLLKKAKHLLQSSRAKMNKHMSKCAAVKFQNDCIVGNHIEQIVQIADGCLSSYL